MSEVLSEGQDKLAGKTEDEFEIVVEVPERKEVGAPPGIPSEKLEALVELLEALKWDKKRLKRYVNQALRLRKLEREYGKSYVALVREYEKLTREEVKLQYSISQLLEKRKRVEEDLQLYMEQHRLTLELVRRMASILDALRKRGLEVEDLEKAVKVLEGFKELGHVPEKIISFLEKHGKVTEELARLEEEEDKKRKMIDELSQKFEELDRELKESYGLVEGLKVLKDEVRRLEEDKKRLEEELELLRGEAEKLREEVERLVGVKADVEEVNREITKRSEEAEKLREEVEKLKDEISELLEVRGSAEDAKTRLQELLSQIERLEERIEEKKSYAELLDGELAAAHTILRLFADPQGAGAEDLEILSQHIQRLAKVKRGEALAQRPLEPYFLEKMRKTIIDLIMPYLKKDFVPRWVFERLERELRTLNEKRVALEEEIASLRRSLEARHKVEVTRLPEEKRKEEGEEALTSLTPEGEEERLKTLDEGKRAKIICIHCREATLTRLPTQEELEELSSKNWRLRFTCPKCGKSYEIDPDTILRKLRG